MIRIDQLNPTVLLSRDYELPAMKDGTTVKLTARQILDLLVDGAPETLDTFGKVAVSLGGDPNFSATFLELLAQKVSLTGAEALSNKTLISPIINAPLGEHLRGHIHGLTLSNNTADAVNDIDIAAGSAASDGATPSLMVLASALTKRLDATWAAGSGNGGLDTGSIANTTYHVWLIQRSDTGVEDALFSASATAPTMPLNYDRKRRIGSILRESAAIVAFTQRGDEFLRVNASMDVSANNPGTSAVTRTLAIPNLINVDVLINAYLIVGAGAGAGTFCYISSPDQSDEAPSGTAAPLSTLSVGKQAANNVASVTLRIRAKNDRTIRTRLSYSDANIDLRIATLGWIDTRGRL